MPPIPSVPIRAALRPAIVLAFVITTATMAPGETAQGAQLLKAEIERGGQVVLQSQFSVSDSFGPADRRTIWTALGESLFEASAPLPGEPEKSGRLVLSNGIRIVVKHAGSPIIQAEVPDLTLVPVGDQRWRMAREDVAATARAAGITLSTLYLVPREAIAATIIAVVAGGSAIAWFTIARRRRRQAA